jgi:hypothetical protein
MAVSFGEVLHVKLKGLFRHLRGPHNSNVFFDAALLPEDGHRAANLHV